MRRRTKLVLTVAHHLGYHPPCPHPLHRIKALPIPVIELGGPHFRCLECWRTWSVASEVRADFSWSDA